MNPVMEKLTGCLAQIRGKTDFCPQVALVLGSGLGGYAERLKAERVVSYQEIEGFPVSTVAGHAGKFLFGYLDRLPIVCMKGRVHFYEGYRVSDVVLPIRLMGLLGAKVLFLTNAAGGLGAAFRPGDLMLLTDHISCFVPNPLVGPEDEALGARFPDMSHVYDLELQSLIREAAKENEVPLQEGVYAQLSGPSYETPAEIRMLRALGADAVGMSTAVEAVAGHHMGMRVCGLSCISNLAAGMTEHPLNHKEVQEAADEAVPRFARLVTASLEKFGAERGL
ncbi:MAG: purine-nucleoside phosphorylase [Clostridium sp.]|nr:purine-nucleoside phosphorylase [Clostridium sp.]